MPEFSFDKDRILEGAEIIEVIGELDTAYDSLPALKEEGYPQEIEEHKDYTEELVYDLCRTPEGELPDENEEKAENLIDNLEAAFNASMRFYKGTEEQRLEVKEADSEKYRDLIQNTPTNVGIDQSKFMKRFIPNSGDYYHLTRSIIYDDAEILDEWAEEIEDVKEGQKPATTPEDREDSARRMFE